MPPENHLATFHFFFLEMKKRTIAAIQIAPKIAAINNQNMITNPGPIFYHLTR